MAVDGGHHVDHECDELQVVLGRFAGGEQQDALVGSEAPVVVFAGSVYACKWLFVEQHAEMMPASHFGNERHQQQVVVVGQVCFLEYGCELKLVGSHFVVASLRRDAEFVAFDFKVEHEGFDARRYGAEIMVFELLVFG